ncbi:hypothetical protein PM082_004338 [Marasmius tenuissimus]|nr:hypothetical protein PM082_004338 [Marasmius tenuissimus]
MAKKKKAIFGFDASSTRYCDSCESQVKLSYGAEQNWIQHLSSKGYIDNAKLFDRKKNKEGVIGAFFKAKPPLDPTIQTAPGPSRLAGEDVFQIKKTTADAIENPVLEALLIEDISTPFPPLLQSLWQAAKSLPDSIPLATKNDDIAQLADDPSIGCDDSNEAWEMSLNPLLHSVFGYGATAKDILHLVRRGPLGIEGFCHWVHVCVTKLHADVFILDLKAQLMIDAIHLV